MHFKTILQHLYFKGYGFQASFVECCCFLATKGVKNSSYKVTELYHISVHTPNRMYIIPYILLIVDYESFRCFTCLPSFLKNISSYQILQAFIVFTCNNLPKRTFEVAKQSANDV